jgi:hypothetical protein
MATLLLGTTIGGYAAIHAGNIASQSVNYASSAGSVAWSNVTGKPTLLSQFTNDLGNYGSWITASYLDDYTRGAYRVISDYGGNSTWYLRGDGQFIWGRGHDWSYSFRLSLPSGSQNNTTWAYIGQQDSNAASGTWRGLRVRKYNSGNVDGDLSAGAFYIGDTRKDQNWDTAYGWGNHASAGYATTSYVTTQIANLVNSAPSTLDTLNELAAALGNDSAFSTTVTTALGNRLRIDTGSQGLNSTQQGYGRTNLGLGSAATYAAGDFALASHNHSGTYLPLGGSWMADFASYGFTRQAGYSVVGGEWVLMSNNAQVSTLLDGSYFAGENGGFYSLNSNNNYTSRKGFYNDGTYANFNTPIYVTGDIVTSSAIYPGFNNGASGAQTSYYFYGNTGNSGIRTNGNLLVNSDIYLGTRGNWLSTYLNQNVRTDSSPTFSSVYFGGSQLTTSMVNGLSNMLGVTTLPYSCDIVVDGDPDRFYAVQFWGGDQDVWRRIIIKRGYSEQAPWDPIGTGVHHGGLLLDWEGNFGGWGGAEYADRIRVFNESYTNVCADMYIYSHSMGYVFMLRGGGAVYHLFSDQPINGFYQSGSPDIAYSTSTLLYDDQWSGTNQYDVPAPTPLTLGQVNSSRIDGLRTKKQSLLDGRYLRQGVDISGIGTITTTNSYATNFMASNAFYLNGQSYYLNSTNGGIYTNARFESATLLVAPGGNSSQWNTAYGWGNHASAGYLTSLPSHNHDDRYYTESESDSRFVNTSGDTMSGRLTLSSISGVSQTVPNDYGAYLHLGSWGVGRTDASVVLVNTAYRADYADSLFDMNISRFTNNSGYITSSGSISGNAATATNASQLNGLSKAQLWNNSGQTHSAYQTFGAIPNFGVWFMQNSSASDSPQSGSQYYVQTQGLGDQYGYGTSAGSYGLMTAVARDHARKYTYYRNLENGGWNGWTKAAAGYADEAGTLSNMNISQFTNNSGYITGYSETDTLQSVTNRGNTTSNRVEFQYAVDRYSQAWRNTTTGAYWWVTTDSDKLGYHRNGDGDKFYFSNGGDFYSTTNGWLSTALAAKQNANTAINTSNIGSQSVSYASSAGSASNLQGYSAYDLITESRGMHSGSDFPNGTLVRTDINADGWAGDSFVMEVSGKSYGSGTPFKLTMEGYLYADTIINVSAMSYGSYFPGPVKVMRLDSNLTFWWPRGSYWNSFEVHVRAAGGDSWNRVTSIGDSSEPNGDKKISITPTQVVHSGNIGSQSVSYATTAGTANAVAWTNVSGRPTNLSQFTNDLTISTTDNTKLPLAGGTLTGNLTLKYSTSDADDYNALTFASGANDYIIKASSSRGVFSRSSYGWHVDAASAFGVYSNGWVQLFGVQGDSGNAFTKGRFVVGGNFGNNAYSSVDSTRLHFGGGDSDANGNYYIGTNKENYGGYHTKLDLCWHTGIRMGAQASYGGIRFFNNEDLSSRIMSIGESDANVRIDNNLWIGGAGGWITDLLSAKQNASTAINTGNIGSQSVSYATTSGTAASSTSTYRAYIEDTRGGQRTPSDYDDYRASWEFTNQILSGWHSVMTLQGWHNGYAAWQIIGPADSAHENWYLRSGNNASWNSLRTIIHSGNIGSQSVNYASSAGSLSSMNISQFSNNSGYVTSSGSVNYATSAGNADTVDGYHASNFLGYQGNSYYQVNTWLQMNGTHGIYWPSYNGAHLYVNTSTSYTQFRIDGSRGGYGGIWDSYSAVHGIMYDSAGNGGVYREANGRWYWYHHIGNNCTGISTSTTSSSYRAYIGGSLYAEGDIVAYSDARKKTDIITIDNALEKVINLRGVYYTRIDDPDRGRQTGVIAQEINEVLPEVVTYASDVDEYGVSYGNIVGVLIEAIKEQQKEIEELKAKLN